MSKEAFIMIMSCNIIMEIKVKDNKDKLLVFKLVQDAPYPWALGQGAQPNLRHKSKKYVLKEVTILRYLDSYMLSCRNTAEP